MNLYNEPKTESKFRPIRHVDFICKNKQNKDCQKRRGEYSLEELDWCDLCGVLTCPKCGHDCPWKED